MCPFCGNGGGFGLLGLIFNIIFIILILAGVAILIWWMVTNYSKGRSPKAIDILKERYARGEISKEEYDEKKKGLT